MNNLSITHIEGIEFHFVETLPEVIESFGGQLTAFTTASSSTPLDTPDTSLPTYDKDFQQVFGHQQAKKLGVSAAGGHNALMVGPPGCGKSLLAETFPSILPTLKQESQFDVMSIHQLSGISNGNFNIRPFRDPHHSASAVSLIGGGANPRPGEVSLAHRGVLFLDEMAEFPKWTLDMLHQPMETGRVTISRAANTVTYPAQFLLLVAMTPCPCGYLGSRHFYCTCSPKQITTYNNRVSRPIQDRMDILLKLETVALDSESTEDNETSNDMCKRVIDAKEQQYACFGKEVCNGNVSNEQLLACSQLNGEQ